MKAVKLGLRIFAFATLAVLLHLVSFNLFRAVESYHYYVIIIILTVQLVLIVLSYKQGSNTSLIAAFFIFLLCFLLDVWMVIFEIASAALKAFDILILIASICDIICLMMSLFLLLKNRHKARRNGNIN